MVYYLDRLQEVGYILKWFTNEIDSYALNSWRIYALIDFLLCPIHTDLQKTVEFSSKKIVLIKMLSTLVSFIFMKVVYNLNSYVYW